MPNGIPWLVLLENPTPPPPWERGKPMEKAWYEWLLATIPEIAAMHKAKDRFGKPWLQTPNGLLRRDLGHSDKPPFHAWLIEDPPSAQPMPIAQFLHPRFLALDLEEVKSRKFEQKLLRRYFSACSPLFPNTYFDLKHAEAILGRKIPFIQWNFITQWSLGEAWLKGSGLPSWRNPRPIWRVIAGGFTNEPHLSEPMELGAPNAKKFRQILYYFYTGQQIFCLSVLGGTALHFLNLSGLKLFWQGLVEGDWSEMSVIQY